MPDRSFNPYAKWGCADVEAYLVEKSSADDLARLAELPYWAQRLHAVPGVIVARGATGPRARIAGTGVDVFEVIQDYISLDSNVDKLAAAYDWLTPEQLQTAIIYFERFPQEIFERIALEEAFARALDPAQA